MQRSTQNNDWSRALSVIAEETKSDLRSCASRWNIETGSVRDWTRSSSVLGMSPGAPTSGEQWSNETAAGRDDDDDDDDDDADADADERSGCGDRVLPIYCTDECTIRFTISSVLIPHGAVGCATQKFLGGPHPIPSFTSSLLPSLLPSLRLLLALPSPSPLSL